MPTKIRSVLFLLLSIWLLHFTWCQRIVEKKAYSYSQKEAAKLSAFPDALYDYGQRELMYFKTDSAKLYFATEIGSAKIFIKINENFFPLLLTL